MKANCTEEIAQSRPHKANCPNQITKKKTIAHIKIAGSKLHKENI